MLTLPLIRQIRKYCLMLLVLLLLTGCALLARKELNDLYGPALPQNRLVTNLESEQVDYWQQVKPIIDSRCVVCHGCYDAPCQLKLTAIEGIERGAHKTAVYNASRLGPADLTRLFEDADATAQWRAKGFFPVLNERMQRLPAHREASLLYRFLELKERHPLPADKHLSDEFTLGLNRTDVCPTLEQFEDYAEANPLWGMPYGLPGLAPQEQSLVKRWLEQGAQYLPRSAPAAALLTEVDRWEAFLNQDSLKAQLVARYIYEHLFLAHLYFSELDADVFFKLVRSATPPGQPVQAIASRRPYDDPGVARPYYRLVVQKETIVAKSHMPYALNTKRLGRWQELFFAQPYEVSYLPGYEPKQAANPFDSFRALPMSARYKFMLDEAEFTIMNYIKGPVCRGGVALNVIQDHFWVFFLDPDLQLNGDLEQALAEHSDDLELPSAQGDIYLPLTTWRRYAAKERNLRENRDDFLLKHFNDVHRMDLHLVWDGDGHNPNAALTIFRHFDSATVKKGLLGQPPKTAWLISYPLLERIHYLLVAGYDVYGNLGHQLLSRLHMDFLRMEGEAGFLGFLPPEARHQERLFWYRGASEETIEWLTNPEFEQQSLLGIDYKTTQPKLELYQMLAAHLGSALTNQGRLETIDDPEIRRQLQRLEQFRGKPTNLLPETALIQIERPGDRGYLLSLLRNNAHLSLTSLFGEEQLLVPEENTISLVSGVIGAYPNLLLKVPSEELESFVDQLLALQTEADYSRLLDRFGVRRTDPGFWAHSDGLHRLMWATDPTEYGWLDYNRLENR